MNKHGTHKRRWDALNRNAHARTCTGCHHMLYTESKIKANTYNKVTLSCNACGGPTEWSMGRNTRAAVLNWLEANKP